jgi:hypothetical protein
VLRRSAAWFRVYTFFRVWCSSGIQRFLGSSFEGSRVWGFQGFQGFRALVFNAAGFGGLCAIIQVSGLGFKV